MHAAAFLEFEFSCWLASQRIGAPVPRLPAVCGSFGASPTPRRGNAIFRWLPRSFEKRRVSRNRPTEPTAHHLKFALSGGLPVLLFACPWPLSRRRHVEDYRNKLQPVFDDLESGRTVYIHCVQGRVRSAALTCPSKAFLSTISCGMATWELQSVCVCVCVCVCVWVCVCVRWFGWDGEQRLENKRV